jgi:hypothetical protein
VYIRMRSLLACSATALAAIGAMACEDTSRRPRSASRRPSSAAAPATDRPSRRLPPVLDTDGDSDRPGSGGSDTDNDAVSTYGHAAGTADIQAIAVLLKRYYTLAATGDGARACSMVYWLFAETVVEEHDRGRGPTSLRGNTCAQVASKLFTQRHRELVEDVATLQVVWVRLDGNRGVALVRFGPARERDVAVQRDHGVWKMNVLLDSGDP